MLNHQRKEKDQLIFKQLEQRRFLQELIDKLDHKQQNDIDQFKQAVFQKLPEKQISALEWDVQRPATQQQPYIPTLEI